jgi:DNA segregation ATPase FtsK/SpoIIIE, S-DNA-T family
MTGRQSSFGRISRIGSARATLPAGALELATHAAVPVALDAAFLNLLRVNFFVDPPLALPFEVEADLLTSPLFREVDDGLYEIDSELRNPLLVSLVSRFGSQRLTQVAILLEQYTDRTAAWRAQPELEHAQRLTALSLVEPAAAKRWLDQAQSSMAGSTALGREWFVAMSKRLAAQPDSSTRLDVQTEEAIAAALDSQGEQRARLAGIHRLGQLALLPGVDAVHIIRTLADLVDLPGSPIAGVASAWLATLRVFVPMPAPDTTEAAAVPAPPAPDALDERTDSPSASLQDLLELHLPDLDREHFLPARAGQLSMYVPIGVDRGQQPVVLGLDETTTDGTGRWGLLVGDGTGRAELLRALVLGLASRRAPEEANFLLVDCAGEQTFAGLADLPHISAVITNLATTPRAIDRLSVAVEGELSRRKRLLLETGHDNHLDYQRARAAGEQLPPLPNLMIICDEFSERLNGQSEFVEMVRRAGSCGMHLLVALSELEPLWASQVGRHLSYQIALSTCPRLERRAVLGVSEDFALPEEDMYDYLAARTRALVPFRAARSPQPLVQEITSRMVELGPPARRIWLPPPVEPSTLDQLLLPRIQHGRRGLTASDPGLWGALRAVVGVVDNPAEARIDPMVLDLSSGNLVLAGGPRSGKTTFLCTLIASLALTHTPREAQFYVLAGLLGLEDLPHMGAAATVFEPDRVRSIVAGLYSLLLAREAQLTNLGVDIARYRQMLREDMVNGDEFGDVFFVVDEWPLVLGEFPELTRLTTQLATRGLDVGIHVLATCLRWRDMPTDARHMFGLRIELKPPGRSSTTTRWSEAEIFPGMTPDRDHFVPGLPRIDGSRGVHDVATAVRRLALQVAEAWSGPRARRPTDHEVEQEIDIARELVLRERGAGSNDDPAEATRRPPILRGQIWNIEGARRRMGLILSPDVYNGTDVPVVIAAEVVEEKDVRDSPLAIALEVGDLRLVAMVDRLSSPMKKWLTTLVADVDSGTMRQVSRAIRIIEDL